MDSGPTPPNRGESAINKSLWFTAVRGEAGGSSAIPWQDENPLHRSWSQATGYAFLKHLSLPPGRQRPYKVSDYETASAWCKPSFDH